MTERPADLRRELASLTAAHAHGRDAARVDVRRKRLEYRLSGAMLDKTIEDFERWCVRRDQEMETFDRRASATVRHLVADGRVRPTLAWHPGPSRSADRAEPPAPRSPEGAARPVGDHAERRRGHDRSAVARRRLRGHSASRYGAR